MFYIRQRSAGKAIIFSILTLGLYGIYWYYKMLSVLYRVNNRRNTAGTDVLLTFLTCGLYGLYVLYQMGVLLDGADALHDLPRHVLRKQAGVFYVLLGLCCLAIVVFCLVQNRINALADHINAKINEAIMEKSGDNAADQVIDQGQAYVTRLGKLQIEDEDIRGQIAHLQQISRQIFSYIAKRPDQVGKLNKFMDYYYPTALKLLEDYEEFSLQQLKGANMRDALAKISQNLATIEAAFEHQLDNLYAEKALDIETDIAVLKDILNADGLRRKE